MFPFRTLSVLFVAFILLGTTACNYKGYYQKSTQDYASRASNDPKMIHIRSYGSLTSDLRQHDNKYFEYSSVLSNKVASLPGVDTALVFLTDKNAYVGLLTDWSATGTNAHGGSAKREQTNTGTTEGVYNVDNGSSSWDLRKVATPYNSYFSHKDSSDLSSEFRQVVGDTIRNNHQKAEEVHISANMEFVNQLLEFAKASWAHKPLAPLTPEFNKLVQYVFGMGNAVPLPLYETGVDGSGVPSKPDTGMKPTPTPAPAPAPSAAPKPSYKPAPKG
jgi:hypothetical protein